MFSINVFGNCKFKNHVCFSYCWSESLSLEAPLDLMFSNYAFFYFNL